MTPITKLSSNFYERFGDDIAHEFAEWMNAMDEQAESRLQGLHELSVSRFTLEQRQGFAELHQILREGLADLHRDMARLEARLAWQIMGMGVTLIGVVVALNMALFHR